MNYDAENEKFHLENARAARDKLKSGEKLSHAEQKLLESHKTHHTKEALSLRAKQDRKKPRKMKDSAMAAVDEGIKDANIAELAKLRNKKIDEASGF